MTAALGEGFKVGHWTDSDAHTGCTVILPPSGNVTSCDTRGSSPSSRELELLHPDRRLTEIHGLLLTGGSAFGLAAATGVVRWLEENGIGYDTRVAKVPIVPAAVILDLGQGDRQVRPGDEHGYSACQAATVETATGRVGAGTGGTVGKWAGFEYRAPGGLGVGSASLGDAVVHALAVVNSVGDVIAEDGSVLAGSSATDPVPFPPIADQPPIATNTVLAVVTVKANLDKRDVRWLAARGSDGVTVSVRPAHTRYDGDVTFAIAAPDPDAAEAAPIDLLGFLATRAVAAAVRNAVL